MLFYKPVYEMTIEEAELERRAHIILLQEVKSRPKIHLFLSVIFVFLFVGYVDALSSYWPFFAFLALLEFLHNMIGIFMFKARNNNIEEMISELERKVKDGH